MSAWNYRPLGEEAIITGLPLAAAAGTAFVLSQIFNPFALCIGAAIGLKHVFGVYTGQFSATYRRDIIDHMIKSDAIRPFDPKRPRDATFIQQVRESAVLAGMAEDSITPYYATDAFLMRTMLGADPAHLLMSGMSPEELQARLAQIANQRSVYFGVMTSDGYLLTTPQALDRFQDKASRMFILGHERAHERLNDSLSVHQPLALLAFTGLRPLLLATASLLAISGVPLLGGYDLPDGWAPFNNGGYIIGPLRAAIGLAICAPLYGLAMAYASQRVERRADRNTLYDTGNLQAAEETLDAMVVSKSSATLSERIGAWFAVHPGKESRIAFMRAVWPKVAAQRAREGRPVQPAPKLAVS